MTGTILLASSRDCAGVGRPTLARRTSGIGNWDQPNHTTCRDRPIWKNPIYWAFWRFLGVTCLRLQRLPSSMDFGTAPARLRPRSTLPCRSVTQWLRGCYATLAAQRRVV
jgi:hypothetical protein